ncbi:hypothetical protein [Kribbella sp. CA-293567]|uniref:hypothetical protein n=1 Tax=Kribbella sp. CA-293567 TaxID=3002436 RepID=UPI0022DDE837|nr:hypothetical protein [Kribbella sp. CA-293567]
MGRGEAGTAYQVGHVGVRAVEFALLDELLGVLLTDVRTLASPSRTAKAPSRRCWPLVSGASGSNGSIGGSTVARQLSMPVGTAAGRRPGPRARR